VRYKTKRYAATDENNARRLASIDKTPWKDVEVSDAQPVHVSPGIYGWVLWDDGIFTSTAGYDGPEVQSISKDAESLISASLGSDSPSPRSRLHEIAEVEKVLSEDDLWTGPSRGVYARDRLSRVRVRMKDGAQRRYLVRSGGHFEGYEFEIFDTLDDALHDVDTDALREEAIDTINTIRRSKAERPLDAKSWTTEDVLIEAERLASGAQDNPGNSQNSSKRKKLKRRLMR